MVTAVDLPDTVNRDADTEMQQQYQLKFDDEIYPLA